MDDATGLGTWEGLGCKFSEEIRARLLVAECFTMRSSLKDAQREIVIVGSRFFLRKMLGFRCGSVGTRYSLILGTRFSILGTRIVFNTCFDMSQNNKMGPKSDQNMFQYVTEQQNVCAKPEKNKKPECSSSEKEMT